MSRRSEKARAKGEARRLADAGPAKPVRWIKRWRMTLITTIIVVAMLLIGLINSFRDPRVILLNKTGLALDEIRVEYPGVSFEMPPVHDKGSTTLELHPAKGGPAVAPATMVRITLRRGDGTPISLRVRYGERGAQEIFTVFTDPDGTVQFMNNNAQGGPGIDLRRWIRRLGINL